jgi:hypothetical protein
MWVIVRNHGDQRGLSCVGGGWLLATIRTMLATSADVNVPGARKRRQVGKSMHTGMDKTTPTTT